MEAYFEKKIVAGSKAYPDQFAVYEPNVVEFGIGEFGHTEVAIFEAAIGELVARQVGGGEIAVLKGAVDKLPAVEFLFGIIELFEGLLLLQEVLHKLMTF